VCYILIFSGSYESALCGTNRGLIGRTCNAKTASCPKPISLQCNIRQQALCGKSLDISCAVGFVVSSRLYPFPRAVSSPVSYLEETEAEYSDVPYSTAARRSSPGHLLMFTLEQKSICSQESKTNSK
jgi:hypothetical protein